MTTRLLPLACLGAAILAIALGGERVKAIDGGALRGNPGEPLGLTGNVVAVPRRSDGTVRVQAQTGRGRVLLEAREPVPDLDIGVEVRARGVLARPPPWLEGLLRRQGIAMVLGSEAIELTGRRRGGLVGRLDAIRSRAEEALGRGMPEREAALARGFVLGQDDSIDERTAEDFRRSGLSHLLAVSGQNVLLLALLAAPLLAVLGVPLRARLLWTIGLIAVYVPLAGAGPSIQRAGVMGVAALVATLAGRPASRLFAVLAAVAVTLALNPRALGDVGWQLSFAAVIGIFLLAGHLREAICARIGADGWRRALAEGTAVTLAATLATAPLIAFHFEAFSVGTLPANVLALPAVAPAMWLGMIVAAAGQVPGLPVEPLNWVNSLLLAYIAQVAIWFGRPSWAYPAVELGIGGLVCSCLGLVAATVLGLRAERSRRPAALRRKAGDRASVSRMHRVALRGAAVAILTFGLFALSSAGGSAEPPAGGLRVSVLDVGQGDAILLQPPAAPAVLVDAGPPDAGLVAKLRERGVESLAAAVVTHDQSDHAGGIPELLAGLPVRHLLYARAGSRLPDTARAAGAAPLRVAEGSELRSGALRSGALRLEVLWPPRDLLDPPPGGSDPNDASLVLLARWHDFSMLLTGDAEAESVPLDPGPVDVLKVAHHGSEDAGLAALLDRTAPSLAVISVGEGNRHGHPTAATLAALAKYRVRTLRTDRDETVTIEVAGGSVRVRG